MIYLRDRGQEGEVVDAVVDGSGFIWEYARAMPSTRISRECV